MSNFLSGKQNAEASDGSFVIQSQRDTSIHVGLSYSEVKEICTDLHEKNFPVLREEARQASLKAVNEFSKVFLIE